MVLEGMASALPVIGSEPGWLEVRLAQRPNGSTTWVHQSDVTLSNTPYAIVVDLATEERIEEAIATVLAGRTSFVVAHRLSTIRRADLIVVLEHGVVVEQGSHEELLERGGRYRSLYGDWLEAASA